MQVISKAKAEWNGSLKSGGGHVSFGTFKGDYTWAGRFETGKGTTPEQLIAAAHASCFSMQLSALLDSAHTPPTSLRTEAHVTMVHGTGITKIVLEVEGVVPGSDQAKFAEIAERAKEICPVSKALAGVPQVSVSARLVSA